MVLHKWAVVQRSAPAPKNLLPIAKSIDLHPRLRPAEYKTPYVLRTFIKDKHISDMQHIENRGMYKEELFIERSRFPRFQKALVVQTDGSLNEREFEFTVPPFVVLFQDRLAAFKQRQSSLAKIGKLRKDSWVSCGRPETCETPMCNALAFPYCVPHEMLKRTKAVDPLAVKKKSGDA